jgi:hypothetical protein
MRIPFSVASMLLLACLLALGPRVGDPPPRPSAAVRYPSPPPGRWLSFDLPSAPFPHADRAEGYSLEGSFYGREGHYADSSVSVFVPPGFKPSKRVNLVFFFHGWMSSKETAEADFGLRAQFVGSGVDALLVLPETGVMVPDSFGGKFEDAGGFARFVGDLLLALDRAEVAPGAGSVGGGAGTIALAGHSGGYRVIASILRRGGLESSIGEVWLFDALYAREEAFADWIGQRRGRFICVSSRGADSGSNADFLASLLRDRGLTFVSIDESGGLDPARLAAPVLFVTSDADHYGVVRERGEFGTFLASSRRLSPWAGNPRLALEARPPTAIVRQ